MDPLSKNMGAMVPVCQHPVCNENQSDCSQ